MNKLVQIEIKKLIVECEECRSLLFKDKAHKVSVFTFIIEALGEPKTYDNYLYYCKEHAPKYDKIEVRHCKDNYIYTYIKDAVTVDEKGKIL